MKKTIIALGFVVVNSFIYGQTMNTETTEQAKLSDTELFTAHKPLDGNPAVFASKAELEEKKAIKISNTKEKLLANRENPEMVKMLQEELWRFENAIAKEIKTN